MHITESESSYVPGPYIINKSSGRSAHVCVSEGARASELSQAAKSCLAAILGESQLKVSEYMNFLKQVQSILDQSNLLPKRAK